jgi:hypothetical protein
MTTGTGQPSERQARLHGRPFGIVVLGGLFVVRALLLLAALVWTSLPEIGPVGRVFAMPADVAAAVRTTPALLGLLLVLVAALLASAVLMWSGRRLGWLVAILTTGLFLLVDLYQSSRGAMNPLWMTLDVVVVFYLNQRDVRDFFSIGAGERAR